MWIQSVRVHVLKDVNRWDNVKIDLYISVNAAY